MYMVKLQDNFFTILNTNEKLLYLMYLLIWINSFFSVLLSHPGSISDVYIVDINKFECSGML